MINKKLIDIFDEIAKLFELLDEPWKPQAYRRAARELDKLKIGVDELYQKKGIVGLKEVPGVGEAISNKIVEYIQTGKIKELNQLKKSVPKHLVELASIPGIGAKRAQILSRSLKIKSISDLKKSIQENKVSELPGFGLKSQQNISDSLSVYKEQEKRKPLKEVVPLANIIIRRLGEFPGTIKVDIAGSLRRKKETIRDIDILVITKKPKDLIEYFCNMSEVKKILAKGIKKAAVILKQNIEVDLRVFGEKNYGAALMYFTGDKNFNIKLRNIAIKKGFKLNEYGLFDRKTNKLVAGKTEEIIFKKLGMKYIEPEARQ